MSDPLISVIIPVYNCELYLREAIESALAQTWRPIEITVIDDGSTDRSAKVARRFKRCVRYASLPHGGPGAARNRGVELARGEYLAFLDADDLWAKNKLELQLAAFGSNARLDAVFGYVEQFISPDVPPEQARKIDCPTASMPGRLPGTMLITREMFARVGGFCDGLRVGEFIEWYGRARLLGLVDLIIPQIVLRRRLHATNSGIVHRGARSDYVRILKAVLDRRRRSLKEIPS